MSQAVFNVNYKRMNSGGGRWDMLSFNRQLRIKCQHYGTQNSPNTLLLNNSGFSSISISIFFRINASTSPQEFCFPCQKHHCVFLPEPFSVKGTKVEKEESHSCSSHISIKRSLKQGVIPFNVCRHKSNTFFFLQLSTEFLHANLAVHVQYLLC